jgi:SAM-dependent methyltransferase
MPARPDIHATAAAGFQAGSEVYERGRPDYPVEAAQFLINTLGIDSATTVVELGAGTGKFTRVLVPLTAAKLIAVEPVESMRCRLQSLLPDLTVLDGTAEAIPLGEATADVVLAAQAFHWFDGRRALADIARVLKPGGKLGLIWNIRDDSLDWVSRMTEIVDRHGAGVPQYKSMEWKRAFDAPSPFSELAECSFRHAQTGNVQMLLDRVASISFIAALPPTDRQAVLAEVMHLVRNHPQTRNLSRITLPYRTDVYWSMKIG